MKTENSERGPSAAFKIGGICLAFMILGYQAALFVHRAAVLKLVADRSNPDTVLVYVPAERSEDASVVAVIGAPAVGGDRAVIGAPAVGNTGAVISAPAVGRSSAAAVSRKSGMPSPRDSAVAEKVARKFAPRRYERFRFDPNTASVDELMRLGFSEKQAQSIDSYRAKGGRFRRKSDFAKSFVVADSVYRRLEPYIDIPKLDLNKADSAAFDALPGVGGYFASKMVEYREQLGGYSCPEQLMDIWHFDREKYDGLSDLVYVSPAPAFRLWTLGADSLCLHPAIRSWQTARSIVLFRENSPVDSLSVGALLRAGILDPDQARKLSLCRIAEP